VAGERKPFRIVFRIDRASVRRALILAGALVLFAIAGVSFAVPVSFSDGNVLTAEQLNDDFTNVEQRLSALESKLGTGERYVVTVSQTVAHAGTPIAALCNPGDRVVNGACYASAWGSSMNIWMNQPIVVGTNGWTCGADAGIYANVIHALATCVGNGVDRSTDAGIAKPVDAGRCPGSAIWEGAQHQPSGACQMCAAEQCCPALDACLLDPGCPSAIDVKGPTNSVFDQLSTCIGSKCGCSL
jgi:hypothetical protein